MSNGKKIQISMDDAGYKEGQGRIIDMDSPEYARGEYGVGDILVDRKLGLEIAVIDEKKTENPKPKTPLDGLGMEKIFDGAVAAVIDNPKDGNGKLPPLNPIPPDAIKRAVRGEMVDIDFVIPGVKAGTVAALIGAGGTGKSFFALQTAIYVALGVDTLDMNGIHRMAGSTPTHGRVVYISAEDDADTICNRIAAISNIVRAKQKIEIDDEEFIEKIAIYPIISEIMDITRSDQMARIVDAAMDTRLCIIDTLRTVNALDENSAREMSILINAMKKIAHETGTTILFLHHTNKSSALSNSSDMQQSIRGSSVLTDNIRCQINLATFSKSDASDYAVKEDERKRYIKISYAKVNGVPPMSDFTFRREAGGVLIPAYLQKLPAKKESNREKG